MEKHSLRGTQRLFRWPILIVVCLIVSVEMLVYVVLRLLVHGWEAFTLQFQNKKVRSAMHQSDDFETWLANARQLDQLEKREDWKKDPKSPYYDYELLQKLVAQIRKARRTDDIPTLVKLLKTFYSKRNFAGIDNFQLYTQTYWGTKYLIHDFIQEILEATIIVRDTPLLSLEAKADFFTRCKRMYGRTALVLSGGAGQGYYHLGVIKTLFEAKCLPKIISGTSAGAMIAGLVGVRNDDELPEILVPEAAKFFTACDESFSTWLRRYWTTGALFDATRWTEKLRFALGGDITFEEAYKKTGRILNISITSMSKYSPPMLLNHITAPHVVVWSAILASCAIPTVLRPVELLEKDETTGELVEFHSHGMRWSDGSIKSDIPLPELMEVHNCNYFVVSQVNPHVILFAYDIHGCSGEPSPHLYGSRLRGGFLSATMENLLKLEMRKWVQLIGNLDLLPSVFGQDWRFVFTQPTRGTLTIFPRPAFRDYTHILTDPDPSALARYIRLSQRNTWPKLTRISMHFTFERTLRSCAAYLLQQGASAGVKISMLPAVPPHPAPDGLEPRPEWSNNNPELKREDGSGVAAGAESILEAQAASAAALARRPTLAEKELEAQGIAAFAAGSREEAAAQTDDLGDWEDKEDPHVRTRFRSRVTVDVGNLTPPPGTRVQRQAHSV